MCRLLWEELVPGSKMGRRLADAVRCALLCSAWKPWVVMWLLLGHVSFSVCKRTVVADQVHPFKAEVFSYASGFIQQYNVPCHSAKILQEWLEEHGKVLPWLPNSPDLNLLEHLWDLLKKQV